MSNPRYISDTLKQKKKKVKKIKMYFFIFLIVLFFLGILYLFQIPQIQITETKISGNSFVTTQEIQDKANSILHSKIAWIIPRSNIFIFPKKTLEKMIKENPAIIDVRVRKDLFKKITIDIVEQEKEALYCTSFDRTNCFYLNNEGFIYSQVTEYIVPEQESIIYLEGDQKALKEYVFEKDLYVGVMSFIKSSARYGIPLSHAYVKSDAILEFQTRSGSRLLTSRYDDLQKDFSNFIALIDQKVITIDQLGQIEYVDLRFGNKVFYKNKTN